MKNDLATSGSAVRPDFLDMATRAALSGVNDASSVVTHVEVADNELKFWSAGAVFELPVGHEIDGGLGWRISRDDVASLLVSPTDRGTAVLPLLLSIGRDDITTRDVLLNLQHALTVDIRGPQAARSRFLSTAALELATSPFADDLRVVCCGFGGDVDGLQRIESVASVAEAIEVIRADPFSIIDVTDPDAAETFSNIVVLVDGPVIDSELDELAQLSLSGIAVLAADIPSHFSLELSPGTIEILPIGRTVIREELTAQHFAAMAELVSTSALTEYVTPDRLAVEPEIEVSDSEDQAFAGKPTVVEAASGDEFFDSGLDCDIELRVLGRVEVIGADRDFESARALDIISYLAFNRDGADADQLKTWIWPVDEPPTDKAFANVMTRARKGLGVDDEGQPYLSKAGTDGVYRLSKLVGTDFDQFQLLVEQSRDLDDDEALSRLVAAVRLVRSVPFTGGGAMGYLWTDNGVRAHIDYAIDEAVHRCADTALALGDSATARWAAFRGLTIVPGCEQCYRRRFLAASLDHNRSELSAAMVELQKMASLDQGEPEASDAISPELVELYEELMRHPTSTQNREAR